MEEKRKNKNKTTKTNKKRQKRKRGVCVWAGGRCVDKNYS